MRKVLNTITIAAMAFFMTSCLKNSNLEIDGVKGPTVKLEGDYIKVDALFENIIFEGDLYYSIPNFPESTVHLSSGSEGGLQLDFDIALNDVFNGNVKKLPPQSLPGGRALPGVSGGRLPAAAFSVEKFDGVVFYVGNDFFGIFYPYDLESIGQGTIITTRYYIGNRKSGTLSVVGPDENMENDGVLLMLNLDNKTKRLIKRMQKLQ